MPIFRLGGLASGYARPRVTVNPNNLKPHPRWKDKYINNPQRRLRQQKIAENPKYREFYSRQMGVDPRDSHLEARRPSDGNVFLPTGPEDVTLLGPPQDARHLFQRLGSGRSRKPQGALGQGAPSRPGGTLASPARRPLPSVVQQARRERGGSASGWFLP